MKSDDDGGECVSVYFLFASEEVKRRDGRLGMEESMEV